MSIIYRNTNIDDGIEGRVAVRLDGKFAVTLFDLDAEATFPMAYIVTDLEVAKAKADKLVEAITTI
jgi:hypothetical protein